MSDRSVSLEATGATGRVAITGTSEITPPEGYFIKYIVVSADMALAAYDEIESYVEQGTLVGMSAFPAGYIIYGAFTSVTPASGEGLGYLSKMG